MPQKWTYLYDHSPLVNTAEKYIDYNKLQPNGNPNARLIITAVNVLTAEPLIFDSTTTNNLKAYTCDTWLSYILFSMGGSRKRNIRLGWQLAK
jgi:hypothetical protein